MTYSTKQKELINRIILRQRGDFTAQDIYHKAKGDAGLTTIYRCIDDMMQEGVLAKIVGDDNTAYYHYLEPCPNEDHFYLRCDTCHKLTHVDCEQVGSLFDHIIGEHDFLPSRSRVVIDGICAKCKRKELR